MLYHFGRLQRPGLALPRAAFEAHLKRAYALYRDKVGPDGGDEEAFLDGLHAADWYLGCACLEGVSGAWDALFAARASRTDSLLVDALRARAVRLFPRDEERQEEAVADFWGYLLAGEREGSLPILARYDGQRPLVPWLIRVFQNRHITELRRARGTAALADDDLEGPADRDLPLPADGDARWHEQFRLAARAWLAGLGEDDVLLLGLRLRYRLSQRQVAGVLGLHEGNVSRRVAKLRDGCLEEVGRRLEQAGWTGDDLSGFIRTEMDGLLLDEPRLGAERLTGLLARKGRALPAPS